MEKKRVLITGCREGIGLDAAQRLAKKGHTVYATVHKKGSVSALEKIFKQYKNVEVSILDITNETDRKRAAKLDVDVLVNNAAIGNSGPLAEIDIDLIKEVFETNVFATLKLTQEVIKQMLEKGAAGRIVFIGSMAGLMPTPFLAPYGMTKFCIENIVYSLRAELEPFGIQVTVVNPGAFDTGFNWKMMKKKYTRMGISILNDKEKKYGCPKVNKFKYNDAGKKGKNNNFFKSEELIKNMAEEDCKVLTHELKSTEKIALEVVKSVEDEKLQHRYYAPKLHLLGIPIEKIANKMIN